MRNWLAEACCMKYAQMGMETAQEPPKETFRRLRWTGKIAGYDMNQATNGVNTHKGALFSIGILYGALGRLPREKCKSCIGRMCGDDKRNC